MFVNEYVMNRKRFDSWTTPKFWKVKPTFYVYLFLFVAGIFGWVYFKAAGASARWQSVGAFLTFVAVYRGVFFQWMRADKMFRVTKEQYYGGKDWTCKVSVEKTKIYLYINGKFNNNVEWDEIIRFEEAKTYFRLATDEFRDGVMLDKESFIKGDAESFKKWMLECHPEIEYGAVDPMFDK